MHNRSLWLLLGIAAISVASMGSATAAQAYIDPPVKLGAEPAHLKSMTELLLENSPRQVEGVGSGAGSEALYETQTETSPDFDLAVEDEIESEVPELLSRTKVWRWGFLDPLDFPVLPAAGSFWVGWEIGSTIWATFFGESPDDPEIAGIQGVANRWYPKAAGQWIVSDSSGLLIAPEWGLAGYNREFGVGTIVDSGKCQQLLHGDGI